MAKKDNHRNFPKFYEGLEEPELIDYWDEEGSDDDIRVDSDDYRQCFPFPALLITGVAATSCNPRRPCNPRNCNPRECNPRECNPWVCNPRACRPRECNPESACFPRECNPNVCNPRLCNPNVCRPFSNCPPTFARSGKTRK